MTASLVDVERLQIRYGSRRVLDEVSFKVERGSVFAILGRNLFNGAGHSFDPANPMNESFRGLGAPRGAWLGLRYEWE